MGLISDGWVRLRRVSDVRYRYYEIHLNPQKLSVYYLLNQSDKLIFMQLHATKQKWRVMVENNNPKRRRNIHSRLQIRWISLRIWINEVNRGLQVNIHISSYSKYFGNRETFMSALMEACDIWVHDSEVNIIEIQRERTRGQIFWLYICTSNIFTPKSSRKGLSGISGTWQHTILLTDSRYRRRKKKLPKFSHKLKVRRLR